jgi:hypothetical protein
VRDRSIVLLDFDGPVCSVFAGYPAPTVARELRQLTGLGLIDKDGGDPLRVLLRATHEAPADVARAPSEAFRDKETAAIETATLTPGGHELIRTALRVPIMTSALVMEV